MRAGGLLLCLTSLIKDELVGREKASRSDIGTKQTEEIFSSIRVPALLALHDFALLILHEFTCDATNDFLAFINCTSCFVRLFLFPLLIE